MTIALKHRDPPDRWTQPRAYSDASLRLKTHGPVQPMAEEPGWLKRLLGCERSR